MANSKVGAREIQRGARLKLSERIALQTESINLVNDLLALPEHNIEWFRREHAYHAQTSEEEITEISRQLLELWGPTTLDKRRLAIRRAWYKNAKPSFEAGELTLAGEVWFASLMLKDRVRQCANEECRRPFVPERETQKLCGRRDCVLWAKRERYHVEQLAAGGGR